MGERIWVLGFGASAGDFSRRRSIIAVINRINPAHRFLAGLLFDDMRYQTGGSCDHENAVEGRGIHS